MAVPNIFGSATSAIPLSQLDQNFATAITLGNTAVYLGNTTTSLGNVTLTNVTISSGNVTVSAGSNTSPSITTVGDTNTGIFFPAADTIAFSEGGVESMRIDSSGNVGIGTASPAYKLDVVVASNKRVVAFTPTSSSGISDFSNGGVGWNFSRPDDGVFRSSIFSYNTAADAKNNFAIQARADMVFATGGDFSNSTERMRIDSSGNVGIGTSSPTAKLDVVGASGANIIYSRNTGTTSADSAQVQLVSGSVTLQSYAYSFAGEAVTGTSSNHPLVFRTNSAERARIDSSGNLLVGTTTASPGNGNNTIGTSVQGATGFYGCREPANYCVYLNSTALDGANRANYISFGLYGTTNIGAIHANGLATVYATSSDYRLKENVAPLNGSLDKVMQLKPCKWKWKDIDAEAEGFIAHELQEVCPSAVSGDKDAVNEDGSIKPQGVDTSFLVATLTAAIQEQQAIITQLQADVAALKGTA